ncbi:hypothetical protein BDY17DRAFT_321269 [Neohortaea acidophila]|uniref:S-adenosyl-L-methionine-dependent methyltransferase n=1 Tax=Neohortaea acidophila TaxID=245834 RepID=A0A6A6Q251_9PEZI|nr:uncharacterized protein BDY17DRAFT_321269 [Neohortaea acidophila]KAF2486480.1 hypothetical protein BDY17DRAFT_321269 [Neohortaea acidophila]
MAESHKGSAAGEQEQLSRDLTTCTVAPENPIQINQIQHRLHLLTTWFGSFEKAKNALAGKTVVEIGCGQGDMTVALAYMVSGAGSQPAAEGKVLAIDPAPLDYGGPYTLGQSQGALTASRLGPYIEWIAKDPVDVLSSFAQKPDYIVLAHCLFYLPSADYLSTLLRSCKAAAARGTKLLLAEWGMRASHEAAEAHVLAVKVQIESPKAGGNVRTVLEPEALKTCLKGADWRLEREDWIDSPEKMDDGKWEVVMTRKQFAEKSPGGIIGDYLKKMEEAAERASGVLRSMDVWTSVSVV